MTDIRKPEYITACCVCGTDVDTREESDGGDPYGCELTGGGWVCSSKCWDGAVNEPHQFDMTRTGDTIHET